MLFFMSHASKCCPSLLPFMINTGDDGKLWPLAVGLVVVIVVVVVVVVCRSRSTRHCTRTVQRQPRQTSTSSHATLCTQLSVAGSSVQAMNCGTLRSSMRRTTFTSGSTSSDSNDCKQHHATRHS